ncbi:hypothetical protein HanRHA438_Chr11g0506621 [Helianthus annuus]|nr:hypothetical protein HanRHA438_Chr11g0506621 [Helianthus annuus]
MKNDGEYYGRYLRVVISLMILFYTHPDPLGFYLIPILSYSFFRVNYKFCPLCLHQIAGAVL